MKIGYKMISDWARKHDAALAKYKAAIDESSKPIDTLLEIEYSYETKKEKTK